VLVLVLVTVEQQLTFVYTRSDGDSFVPSNWKQRCALHTNEPAAGAGGGGGGDHDNGWPIKGDARRSCRTAWGIENGKKKNGNDAK
jgi:hypothetical protein